MKYPFKTTEELRNHFSGVDAGFEISNLNSGLRKAVSQVKDIVSSDVYTLMQNHYESSNYNQDGETDETYIRLNELVDYVQFPLAHFAFFFHFIWLQLRVGSDTLSVTDKENTPYKYQHDQAKDELLESAYSGINDLYDFLNEKATKWTAWAASTTYAVGDIVKNGENYYTANTAHTSSEDFATDSANWDATLSDNIIFKEWTNSEQYTDLGNDLFSSYREFDTYFGIDGSAAFYVKTRTIRNRAVEDDISPRADVTQATTKADTKLMKKIKLYVAFKTMADAALQLDYFLLPSSLRKDIDSEYTKKSLTEAKNMRDSTARILGMKAEEYLADIDIYIAQKGKEPDDSPYEQFESKVTEDDKHSSIGI